MAPEDQHSKMTSDLTTTHKHIHPHKSVQPYQPTTHTHNLRDINSNVNQWLPKYFLGFKCLECYSNFKKPSIVIRKLHCQICWGSKISPGSKRQNLLGQRRRYLNVCISMKSICKVSQVLGASV